MHLQPIEDVLQMLAHRGVGEAEPPGDLSVRVTGRDQPEQLPLPVGELLVRGGAGPVQAMQVGSQQGEQRAVTLAEIRAGTPEQDQSDRTPGGAGQAQHDLALHPGGASAFFKGAGALVLVVGVAFVSGIGSDFFDRLPFIGTIDQENVEYRQRLAETSWQLIQQNPYFGNPFAVLQMESLRQGSGGIIDLVNAYANIALFYGLVTLAVFALFALLVVTKGIRATRRLRGIDNDLALLGGTLVGALIASLLFIATALLETSTFVVAALVGSFIRLAAARLQAQASPAPAPMFGAPLRPFASQK